MSTLFHLEWIKRALDLTSAWIKLKYRWTIEIPKIEFEKLFLEAQSHFYHPHRLISIQFFSSLLAFSIKLRILKQKVIFFHTNNNKSNVSWYTSNSTALSSNLQLVAKHNRIRPPGTTSSHWPTQDLFSVRWAYSALYTSEWTGSNWNRWNRIKKFDEKLSSKENLFFF